MSLSDQLRIYLSGKGVSEEDLALLDRLARERESPSAEPTELPDIENARLVADVFLRPSDTLPADLTAEVRALAPFVDLLFARHAARFAATLEDFLRGRGVGSPAGKETTDGGKTARRKVPSMLTDLVTETTLPIALAEHFDRWGVALEIALFESENGTPEDREAIVELAQALAESRNPEATEELTQNVDFLLALTRLVPPASAAPESTPLPPLNFADEDPFLVDELIQRLGDPDHVLFASRFLQKHLPPLVELGLVSPAHLASLIRQSFDYSQSKYPGAYNVLRDHIVFLVEKGLFGKGELSQFVAGIGEAWFDENARGVKKDLTLAFLEGNLALFLTHGLLDAEGVDRLLSAFLNWKTHVEVRNFFREEGDVLIRGGFLGRPQVERILSELFSQKSRGTRMRAMIFLVDHFGLLHEEGLVREEDFEKISAALDGLTLDEPERKVVLDFYLMHAGILLEEGLFRPNDYRTIKAALERGDHRAVATYSRHAGRLLTEGYLTPQDVGRLASYRPSDFMNLFHPFRLAGLITRETLAALLDEAHSAAPFSPAVRRALDLLADSDFFLSSQMRWKKLLSFLGWRRQSSSVVDILFSRSDGEEDTAIWFQPIGALFSRRETREPTDPNEVMSLVMVLSEMTIQEMTALALWTDEDQTAELRKLFVDLAKKTGLDKHPEVRSLLKALRTEGGRRLATDLKLMGIEEAWIRDIAQLERGGVEPEQAKRIQRAFINFVVQQAKRKPPSWIRLTTKRGRQIIDEGFVSGLTDTSLPPEEIGRFLALSEDKLPLLRNHPLFSLLSKTARFSYSQGVAAIRKLILGLHVLPVTVASEKKTDDGFVPEAPRVKKVLTYYRRYEELEGVLSESFLAGWKNDSEVDLTGTLDPQEGDAGLRTLKRQALSEIRRHLRYGVAPDLPTIGLLGGEVSRWLDAYETSDELKGTHLDEARRLQGLFEAHFGDILNHYGSSFVNIRFDLRNLVRGLERGLRVARRSERFLVSGEITAIGQSGSIPTETCQSMEFPWEENRQGEPVNRLMHGQFKIAQWEMDGEVVARHLLEVTVDRFGREHLLVEELFTMGGFGRMEEFREMIVREATRLGIDRDHVHFDTGEAGEEIPAAIATGDKIYRQNFREGTWTLERIRQLRKEGFPLEWADLYSRIVVHEEPDSPQGRNPALPVPTSPGPLHREAGRYLKVAKYAGPEQVRPGDEALLREAGFHFVHVLPGRNPNGLPALKRGGFSLKPRHLFFKRDLARFPITDEEVAYLVIRRGELLSRFSLVMNRVTVAGFRAWQAIYREANAERLPDNSLIPPTWFEWAEKNFGEVLDGTTDIWEVGIEHPQTGERLGGAIVIADDLHKMVSIHAWALKPEIDYGDFNASLILALHDMARARKFQFIGYQWWPNLCGYSHDPVHLSEPLGIASTMSWSAVPHEFEAVKLLAQPPGDRQILFLGWREDGEKSDEVEWKVAQSGEGEIPDDRLPMGLVRFKRPVARMPLSPTATFEERVKVVDEFGIKIAEYESTALYDPADEQRLAAMGVHLVRIRGMNQNSFGREWEERGYVVKPFRIGWTIPTPESDEVYIGSFSPKTRNTLRRKLNESAPLRIEAGRLTAEEFREWHPIYEAAIREMPRGLSHLKGEWYDKELERLYETGEGRTIWKIFVRDPETGKLLAGVLLHKEKNQLSIGYVASPRVLRDRELSLRFVFETMKLARSLGVSRLAYGADLNLFGHHEEVGLFFWKMGLGFKPDEDIGSGWEAMKILDTAPFLRDILMLEKDRTGERRIVLMEGHGLNPDQIARIEEKLGLKVVVRTLADFSPVPKAVGKPLDGREGAAHHGPVQHKPEGVGLFGEMPVMMRRWDMVPTRDHNSPSASSVALRASGNSAQFALGLWAQVSLLAPLILRGGRGELHARERTVKDCIIRLALERRLSKAARVVARLSDRALMALAQRERLEKVLARTGYGWAVDHLGPSGRKIAATDLLLLGLAALARLDEEVAQVLQRISHRQGTDVQVSGNPPAFSPVTAAVPLFRSSTVTLLR